MSSQNPLKQLCRLDGSSSEFHDQVSNILYGGEYRQWVPNLQSDDLVGLVDYLDKALGTLDPASSAFRKCLRELRDICGARTILPPSCMLSSSVLDINPYPVASGGPGDVYEGTLNGSKVCVKRIRVYSQDGPEEATKTLYKEAVVWKRLEHQNIVPLLGITSNPLQLISEWMSGGDLREYIKKHPDADRIGLLSDAAGGLYFLHSRNIVHGDLKGPNILMDDAGRARITDFGLATVTQNLDSMRGASGGQSHAARWTAPEILNEEGTFSKESDVFSFAMVMIEGFTGAVPFKNILPAAAMFAVMTGKRPSRPTHPALTDQLWALMQRCWDQNPHSRPEVSDVVKVLRGSCTSASTPILGQRHLLAGYTATPLNPPSPHNAVPSPSRRIPQITLQKTDYHTDSLFPVSRGGSAQDGQSRHNPDNSGKNASCPDLLNPGSEAASRRPPRRDPSRMNAYVTKNTSHHKLSNGTKFHHQPRSNLGKTLQENQGSSQNNRDHGIMQEPVAPKPPKKHRTWRRPKHARLPDQVLSVDDTKQAGHCSGWGWGSFCASFGLGAFWRLASRISTNPQNRSHNEP